MNVLSTHLSSVLAEKNGWSRAYAIGFFEGACARKSRAGISSYSLVGLDEYCKGVRAGYFARQQPGPARLGTPAMPEWAAASGRDGTAAGPTAAITS